MTQEELISHFCNYRGKCTTDDVAALTFAYRMLAPRWISVEDALPEEDGKYLFFSTRGGVQCAYYYKGLTMGSTITHWMPLPPTEGIRENQGKISPNRIIGTEEHIKIALDVMKKGGEQ